MKQYIFYIIAAVILAFSLLAVTSRQILRAAVYLLFALVATAGIYFIFEYNFLAAIQLTVYAGGIVVLIIFSILLTSQINDQMPAPTFWKKVLSAVSVILLSAVCILALWYYGFEPTESTLPTPNIKNIGEMLLGFGADGYVLPFEVISVLLLAAMIGAILIAKKIKPGHKI